MTLRELRTLLDAVPGDPDLTIVTLESVPAPESWPIDPEFVVTGVARDESGCACLLMVEVAE